MATFRRFEDIEAWQRGRELNARIYALTQSGAFAKDFALRDQIRRASISVSSNIAEGYARQSAADFARFLVVARASAADVVSQLYLALDLGYIDQTHFDATRALADESSAACAGLIRYLRSDRGIVREPDATWDLGDSELRTLNSELEGTHVLVTAGPTREALDPVRFLSNGSTGQMGFALAAAAARRGARVTLLAGPVALDTPPGVDRIDIVTADDLLAAALAHAEADVVIAAAAVSDYAPAQSADRKLKKSDDDLTLSLRRTPDVLAELGAQKRDGQTLVGFALETHDGEAHARGKLARKHLDWIALNVQGEAGAGMGSATNRVTLLGADGARVEIPTGPKAEVAEAILDAVTR